MVNPARKVEGVVPEGGGGRLDACLAKLFPDYSRVYLRKLIENGAVSVNGADCVSPRKNVVSKDALSVAFPPKPKPELMAEKIDLPVLFEDDFLLVIDKPAGIVCHPAAGNWTGTVVNALMGRDAGFADFAAGDGDFRPGIVHRLDKDTSGCLVVAKNAVIQAKLSAMFAARRIKKTYLALVVGAPAPPRGRIETLIGRHPADRKKMAVVRRNGKAAVTDYEVIKLDEFNGRAVSLVKVVIGTGRTHQIRVHMAHLRCPVVGDAVYGGRRTIPANRQLLHAWRLEFKHPVGGKELCFESPIPPDFAAAMPEK